MALAATVAIPSCTTKEEQVSKKEINVVSNDRFDPWIEIIPEAIRYNAKVLYQLSGNKPIMAVVKNNGYGLGDVNVAKILEEMPEIVGFAAVKTEACLSIREAGIKKTILHMGMATDQDFSDLAANDIQLSIYNQGMRKLLDRVSNKFGKSVKAHLYIDTGMSRMGIPYHKALP